MKRPLVFYVEFHVKHDSITRFETEAQKVLEAMSDEDTFIDTFFHRHSDDPTRFTLYERWAENSMDDFVNNQLKAKDYRTEYERILPEMLASPRRFTVLEPIKSWQSLIEFN